MDENEYIVVIEYPWQGGKSRVPISFRTEVEMRDYQPTQGEKVLARGVSLDAALRLVKTPPDWTA